MTTKNKKCKIQNTKKPIKPKQNIHYIYPFTLLNNSPAVIKLTIPKNNKIIGLPKNRNIATHKVPENTLAKNVNIRNAKSTLI